jgi:hypothetical protein
MLGTEDESDAWAWASTAGLIPVLAPVSVMVCAALRDVQRWCTR